MRRRDFIKGIVGSATVGPLAVRAQQPERVRHVGVLMNLAATDAEGQARLAAFLQGLQEYGWAVGRNMRRSTSAGPQAMLTTFENTRRNWLRSRRTSFWSLAVRPWGRC